MSFTKLARPNVATNGGTYTHKCGLCGRARGWEYYSDLHEEDVIECDVCLHTVSDETGIIL